MIDDKAKGFGPGRKRAGLIFARLRAQANTRLFKQEPELPDSQVPQLRNTGDYHRLSVCHDQAQLDPEWHPLAYPVAYLYT